MPLGKAVVLRQEDIDLDWMAMEAYCLRAFFFEGDCHDEMGVEDGVPTGVSYVPCCRHEPRVLMQRGKAAEFVPALDSRVVMPKRADLDGLTELSVSVWVFARSLGGGGGARLHYRYQGASLWLTTATGSYKLWAMLAYTTTDASSLTVEVLADNEWHHVAVTYSEGGDRKLHIYVDGEEAEYALHVASVGTRKDDSGQNWFIGNSAALGYGWDGFLTEFLLYSRALTLKEVHYLAQKLWQPGLAELTLNVWEPWGRVDVYRAPRGFPGWSAHGVLSIEFDGMSATIHSAAKPVLDAFGVKGGVSVVTSEIGGPGKLGPGELHDLSACGWEIVSQGVSGVDLAGVSAGQLRAELGDSREVLRAYGGARHFAWPVDLPHGDVRQVCAEYYESAGRGGTWEWDYQSVFGLGHLVVEDPAEIAAYKDAVDWARYSGRYVTLVQRVVGPDQVGILEELLQYAKDLQVPVVTRSLALEIVEVWPPIALHGGASVYALNVAGIPEAWWRWVEKGMGLPAGRYMVSFYAWKDDPYRGAPVSAEDVEPYAEDHVECLVGEPHYEHVVDGIYFCWTVFDAPAGLLRVGALVRTAKSVWISMPELEAVE